MKRLADRLRSHGASERRICHYVCFNPENNVDPTEGENEFSFIDAVDPRKINLGPWYRLSQSQSCDLSKIVGHFVPCNPRTHGIPTTVSSWLRWPNSFDITEIAQCLTSLASELTDADIVDEPKLPDPNSEV